MNINFNHLCANVSALSILDPSWMMNSVTKKVAALVAVTFCAIGVCALAYTYCNRKLVDEKDVTAVDQGEPDSTDSTDSNDTVDASKKVEPRNENKLRKKKHAGKKEENGKAAVEEPKQDWKLTIRTKLKKGTKIPFISLREFLSTPSFVPFFNLLPKQPIVLQQYHKPIQLQAVGVVDPKKKEEATDLD